MKFMNDIDNRINFVIDNARLEHMYHTEDEINRIREVATGKKTCSQAIHEIISLHVAKYGQHI